MLEAVVNVSDGRPGPTIDALVDAAGDDLLDIHVDADHNRGVLTLVGEDAPMAVARVAVERIDLRGHTGVHPRIGALDVVPFVPLGTTSMAEAIAARDRFATWAGDTLALPCFLYGPERSLPDVRRGAFTDLVPDTGPRLPHPTAGACAVGARPVLVAYNVWLASDDLGLAQRIARSLRSDAVRALGLRVGREVQVSVNLLVPDEVGPADVYDAVRAAADISRAELVGLLPEAVLAAVPPTRWLSLDLAPDRTIEASLAARAARRR